MKSKVCTLFFIKITDWASLHVKRNLLSFHYPWFLKCPLTFSSSFGLGKGIGRKERSCIYSKSGLSMRTCNFNCSLFYLNANVTKNNLNGKKEKLFPQNNSCYILRFISCYYEWQLWFFRYLTLLKFAVCFFSYIDLFLSISVSELTMDLNLLLECGCLLYTSDAADEVCRV